MIILKPVTNIEAPSFGFDWDMSVIVHSTLVSIPNNRAEMVWFPLKQSFLGTETPISLLNLAANFDASFIVRWLKPTSDNHGCHCKRAGGVWVSEDCMGQDAPIAFQFGTAVPTIILELVANFEAPNCIFGGVMSDTNRQLEELCLTQSISYQNKIKADPWKSLPSFLIKAYAMHVWGGIPKRM